MASSQRARREEAEIVLKANGFSKRLGDKDLFCVLWAEVREVRAYKRDLFSTDLLCLGFRDTEADQFWEVHEEMNGFDALRRRLAEVFPIILFGWYEQVVHPAFATNLMVLFSSRDPGEP